MTSSTGYKSRLDLASQPTAVHWARVHTEDVLRGWALPDFLVEDAVQVVSELAGNAVRHAGSDTGRGTEGEPLAASRFTVGLWIADCGLIIAVHDQERRPPVRQEASPESESGRGLALVDALSASWGYAYPSSESGKFVYAVLSPPEGESTAAQPEREWQNAGVPAAVTA
jgi:anti-sigma regulatory factor (Ser/Thr protein kinase)